MAIGLCAMAACGDDAASPIVRVAQTAEVDAGTDGTTGWEPGDMCAPCGSHSDCAPSEACVELTRGGDHFCSGGCGPGNGNGHCPPGFVCGFVYNASSPMCVPAAGDCTRVGY
jgi:hypothetical protein